MGFTIAEIGVLMHGFTTDTSAAARWQILAARKLVEVEVLIARAEGMKHVLGEALRCQCLTFYSCAHAFQARTCSGGNQRC
jgi:hypothetical protein